MDFCLPVLSRYGSSHLHPPILKSSPHSTTFFLPPQRLLVQASVQAKPGHVSPLQLTNIQVPQQVRLLAPASCGGRELLPQCLLVSVLARVPGKGIILRLPLSSWLWAVASRGKIKYPRSQWPSSLSSHCTEDWGGSTAGSLWVQTQHRIVESRKATVWCWCPWLF